MPVVVSLVIIAGTVVLTETLVDRWIGEDGRLWIGLGGLVLLLLSGFLLKASGLNAVTRALRSAVIKAGLASLLARTGLRLAGGQRRLGVETAPDAGIEKALTGLRFNGGLLWTGWVASLAGLGMVWTGVFAR